jgi:hypothetical protein
MGIARIACCRRCMHNASTARFQHFALGNKTPTASVLCRIPILNYFGRQSHIRRPRRITPVFEVALLEHSLKPYSYVELPRVTRSTYICFRGLNASIRDRLRDNVQLDTIKLSALEAPLADIFYCTILSKDQTCFSRKLQELT